MAHDGWCLWFEYKCYNIPEGCMGLTESGIYELFDSEADYKEYYEETNKI